MLLLNELQENGFALFPNFVQGPMLKLLQQECDRILEKNRKRNDYLFGTACRIGSFAENKNSVIGYVFDAPLIWELSKEWLGSIGFTEIFITHEWTTEKGLDRNGFLHFDRLHTFKFLIYLTDVDEESGAFSCCPKSHKLGKELRIKGWKETQDYGKVKNRPGVDFPDVEHEPLKAITGKAGDLIIFDTDTFHLGGKVQNGKERKLIRLHIRS